MRRHHHNCHNGVLRENRRLHRPPTCAKHFEEEDLIGIADGHGGLLVKQSERNGNGRVGEVNTGILSSEDEERKYGTSRWPRMEGGSAVVLDWTQSRKL
jgi:hypothetical protein